MAANDPLLNLAYSDWPAADRMLWEQATSSDDPFADAARLAKSTKCGYWFGYRRFLDSWRSTSRPPWKLLPPSG